MITDLLKPTLGHVACPDCGSARVESRVVRRPAFAVDAALYQECRCRKCGRSWRRLLRSGI